MRYVYVPCAECRPVEVAAASAAFAPCLASESGTGFFASTAKAVGIGSGDLVRTAVEAAVVSGGDPNSFTRHTIICRTVLPAGIARK